MNSIEILTVIQEIAATRSKLEKLALVTEFSADEGFKRVLENTYNPFKTYGIRKVPAREPGASGTSMFDDTTWRVLDQMQRRVLTGTAMQDTVWFEINNRLDEQSADLFKRIILKDLRADFSESTINKAVKGLIPEFPYQRCSLPKDTDLAKWPWEKGVISQEKADAMFANVDHEEGGLVSIRSRQGSEFPMDKFEDIAAEVRARLKPGCQQHGELTVVRDGKVLDRATGNGVLNSVLDGGDFAENEKPVYVVWDQIPLSAIVPKGKHNVAYLRRFCSLRDQLKAVSGTSVVLIPTRVVKSLAEAYAHAVELMKQGKEGTVIKHPDAIWKDGTSKEQIKLKLEFEVDLEVVAIVPGKDNGKNAGRAGSLTCRTCDGKLLVDVTVKNEDMRAKVDANPEDWIGRIIVVTANDILEPSKSNDLHSLFLPRMSEAAYRRDKTVADTLERVYAQKEAAILGQSILKEAA